MTIFAAAGGRWLLRWNTIVGRQARSSSASFVVECRWREKSPAPSTFPLDLVLLRGLLQREPGNPVRAASVAGKLVLDDALKVHAKPPLSVEELFVAEALEAFAQREMMCRGARPAVDIAGRTILLVDNGMRTCATMRGAISAVRSMAPARIVAATPIAAPEALPLAKTLADEVVCLATPEPFGNVAMWYERFNVPADEQIHEFLLEPK